MRTWVALLAVSVVNTANAYELKQTSTGNLVRWHESEITYKVHSSTSSESLAAVRASFNEWNGRANVAFRFAGGTDVADSGFDVRLGSANENTIRFVTKDWVADKDAFAVTYTLHEARSGRIVSADIEINAVDFNWSTDGAPNTEDVANVVAHEAGHFAGLGHSLVADATMFASAKRGETTKRDLHADDIAGIEALYGVADPEEEVASSRIAGPTATPNDQRTPTSPTTTARVGSIDRAETLGGCGGASIARSSTGEPNSGYTFSGLLLAVAVALASLAAAIRRRRAPARSA